MVPQKTILSRALFAAMAGASLLAADLAIAQQETTVTITGSRLKRVDAEGALPVTVISREQIDSSGATSVSELIRTVTFAATGNFRPASGSSAMSVATVDLKGLGAARTLVLVDGRRTPKSPSTGAYSDLNTIPLGAIERVEILTDGASAVYGSDAIGGVVNIITRKDFEGVQAMVGYTAPTLDGGDRRELSLLWGASGKSGRMLAGVSFNSRDIVFQNQRPNGQIKGVSSYGNNYFIPNVGLRAVPGGCDDKDFWTTASGTCSFDFNSRGAYDAANETSSLFAKGDLKVANGFTFYTNASVSRNEGFGRYAPVPGTPSVTIAPGSPNHPSKFPQYSNLANQNILLYHRFAAAGNRDNTAVTTTYDLLSGLQGSVGKSDIDVGVRWTDAQMLNTGRGYIVKAIAEKFINSGEYNIFKPSTNPEYVLKGITTNTNRDAFFKIAEVYGTSTFQLGKMAGGEAQLLLGLERRTEDYQDIYDSLSEAGQILGSAGNSAAGSRSVNAYFAEAVLPIVKNIELSLAARHESYSDYGSDTSPKASVRWKPTGNLLFRGSLGNGFRAPSLEILHQKTTYSAESVLDPATYVAFGGDPALANSKTVQVTTYFQANPDLESEKSENASIGAVWDVNDAISFRADYWRIKVRNQIGTIGAQTIVDRANGTDPRDIPPGLKVVRRSDGAIDYIIAGFANEGNIQTTGLDISADLKYRLSGVSVSHSLNVSRAISYKDDGDEYVGSLGFPKHRAVLSTRAKAGGADVVFNANQIGANGTGSRRMMSVRTYDLQVNVDSFIKGGRITVGVVNLLGWYPGERGPLDPAYVAYGGRDFNFYLYDSYGRQPYIRYTQSF